MFEELDDRVELLPSTPEQRRATMARGRVLRRRRRARLVAIPLAAAAVAAVLVGSFGSLPAIMQRTSVPGATTGPSPTATSSMPPGLSIPVLVPADLRAGPAPTVDYVHDGAWVSVGGRTVQLADPDSLLTDRGDGFVGIDGGLLAVRDLDQGPAEVLGYSREGGQPAAVPGADRRLLGGAQPGPFGTVLIPVVGGYAVAHPDGTWRVARHFGDPAVAGAPPVVAVSDAVFHAWPSDVYGTVVRRSELDPAVPPIDNEGWTRPVTSVPGKSNALVLADHTGCQQLIGPDSFALSWYTCDWDLRQLSNDGTYAAGLSTEHGWAVVDNRTHNPVLSFGRAAVQADSFRFDASGQLNLVVRSDAGDSAIVTCTMAGRCWLAAPWSPTPYVLVQSSGS